ncbi:ubiquitin carboxyl-terminal hydrolase 25-like, partial [Aphis craccivora]
MLIRALAKPVIRIANLRPDIDDLSLPTVFLTAPTGTAAYGIKGLTLHSVFKLPLNQFSGLKLKLSSDISNTLRCQFANVKLLIIDKISMVGIKTLRYIDQQLRSILRINKPFDDIITEIMRQKYDKQLAIMLTKLARGQLEKADVKHFQNHITYLDITFQPQMMHLWATNNEVDEMISSMNQVSFISEAIDTSAKRSDIESAKKFPRQKTTGLALSIVNGAIGEFLQINKGQTAGGKEVAKRVWIKFDEPDVGSLTRQKIKNKLKPEGEHTDYMCKWTPIEIIKLEFQLGNAEHHKVTRMQLPLVEALALAVHKSQGATYQSVAFHIPQKFLKCNMLYVGCSRATSAQGLRIDYFPAKPPKPSAKVEHEMCRLRTSKSINHKETICSTTLLQDQKKNTHIEAIEVIIENITYIGIYSSPNFPVPKLCDFIETVASTKNNFIFIGDFSINFNTPPKQLVQILKHFNYKILVDSITTADHGTTIDNVITNVDIAALVYESFISDHRPILVMNIDTFKEIEKYSETVDDQIVQEVKNNFIKPNFPAIDGFPVEKSKKSVKSTKVDNDTILVPETKTTSTKIVDYNIIINDIQILQVNSNTLKVPENCNIRSDSLLETISDNATMSKNPKTIKISSIKNKVDITSSSIFCGLLTLMMYHKTLDDCKCNNCNNVGGSEDKHQIIEANEYIVIELKLFIPIAVNGQFVTKKISDLKHSGVPTSVFEIAGAQYKTQAAILHMGENTSSGHYIAYLRQGTSN